jgi:hypothetical protein
MALLEVSGLRAGYGKIDILHDVDVALEERSARSSAQTAPARRRYSSRFRPSSQSAPARCTSTAQT